MTDGCTGQLASGAVGLGDSVGVLGTTLVLKAVAPDRVDTADGTVYSHHSPTARGGRAAPPTSAVACSPAAAGTSWHGSTRRPRRAARPASSATRSPHRGTLPVADRRWPPAGAASPATRWRRTARLLEGVAFVERLGLETLARLGAPTRHHVLAGGGSRSDAWNRVRAGVLAPVLAGGPVTVAPRASSAVGATLLAALALDPATDLPAVATRLLPAARRVEPADWETDALAASYDASWDCFPTPTTHDPTPPKGPPAMADQTTPTSPADELPEGVRQLLARSNRLGSDPAVTNYGGGNTSAKVTVTNPASGDPVELLYVKGSGGDLGTLKAGGLAVLERDRLVALDRVYRGVEHEDEMVGLFSFCSFGPGGAAPSIDTPMHGLVDHDHVDHLHPDSVIALACAADGEKLVEEIWAARWRGCRGSDPGGSWARRCASCPRATASSAPSSAGTASPRGGRRATRSSSARCASSARRRPTSTSARSLSRSGRWTRPGRRSRRRPAVSGRPRSSAPARRRRPRLGRRRPLHRQRGRPRLPRPREVPRPGPLGTSCPDHFCAPRCVRCCSTPPPTPPSRRSSPGWPSWRR